MTATTDPRKVFVIHGRHDRAKEEVFAFLKMIGLSPIPWGEAVRLTKSNAPFIGKILEAALPQAQAVVVLLTGDDEARLIKSEFFIEDEDDKEYYSPLYQPRPNVIFEAAMALSTWHADKTILVEVGKEVKICRGMVGRHRIKLSNHLKHRWELVNSLKSAGCAVRVPNNELLRTIGNFDFEW
jgi:predicted nucleotide-binding protein